MEPDLCAYRITPPGRTGSDVTEIGPHILLVPSYGGIPNSAPLGSGVEHVHPVVLRWLRDIGKQGRSQSIAVIATGNRNFGGEYALAGHELSAKLGIPLLYTVELSGMEHERRETVWRIREFSRQYLQSSPPGNHHAQ